MTKVVLLRSSDYDEECKLNVRKAIELLGGISNFVKPDDIVLIKPNLIVARDGESGNVTHSSIIEPLIEMCYDAGASKIYIGDGSGNADTFEAFTSSGMKAIVDKLYTEGIPIKFVDLNYDVNPNTKEFDAIDLGPYALNPEHVYRVAHTVLKADVMISLPKLKSHNGTGITIALKNIIGTAPGGHYGFPKKQGKVDALPHFSNAPWNSLAVYDRIWRTIIDLNRIALGRYPQSPKKRKYLAVVDGVIGGTFDPSSKELPLWNPVKVGAIIAGGDPVAVDTICARLMCYRPERIPTIVNAAEKGLGTMTGIEVVGERVDHIRTFVPPSSNWVRIVDTGVRQVWPKFLGLVFRKVGYEWAVKLRVFNLIQKLRS